MDRIVPLLAAAAGLILSGATAVAGSATWLATPATGDWNTAGNWTVGGPPNGVPDTATFQFSAMPNVSLSADTQVNGVLFSHEGQTGYTIAAASAVALTISGFGIVNDSGLTQNFVAGGSNGVIRFANSATAGSNTSFTTNGGNINERVFGVTEFRDNSSAGSAVFSTKGGAVADAFGGVTQFFDNATAASGIFTNSGAATNAGSGVTLFYNSSTAGNAAITNNGGVIDNRPGGFTVFFDSSSAGNGTFINNGGSVAFALGGIVQFFDNSSAGAAAFILSGGAVNAGGGGIGQFWDNSTAGSATFTTDGGAAGKGGGTLEFRGSSSAGNGTFTTNGIAADFAEPGYTRFLDSASASNGTFVINGGASNGVGGGGVTEFWGMSSAGDANFTINGSTQNDGSGGTVEFRDNASAANGTFVINGSAFRAFVCPADICTEHPVPLGRVIFIGGAAGNATLIANGGTDGGDGAAIVFGPGSSGGTARVEVFGNGRLDITGRSDPGATIGSLEGTGAAFLGMNLLSVGSNNLSTTFSGVIQDGNNATGGSLAKIGAGTLTLSGANTYTGATTINDGKLRVDGSITSAVTVNNGGRLGGAGTTASVTVESGGILAPGDSLGALTINGSYTQKAGGVLKIEIAGTDPGASDHLEIAGSATIDGTLEVRFLNGFLPVTGQVFKLFNVAGAFAGSFAQIIFPDLRTGFQFKAEFVNGTYQITALNDGVAAHGFLNLSTRARVGTGDNGLIGGFIITGNASRKVIIRALGPSLAVDGTPLPNRLIDPTLELRDNAGALIFSNDNWVESPQKQQIIESGIPPSDAHEAAIVATLAPDNYTAIMRGVNNSESPRAGTTGIGLVEVYDLADYVTSSLANISSRGLVETGDNVMIAGFIVDSQASQLIVRAMGPSLTQFGIANALADPTVELYNGNGNIIAFNNDWQDTDQEKIEATGIPPVNDKESTILATLAPGNYTAIVRGQNETIGVGLIEVYNLH